MYKMMEAEIAASSWFDDLAKQYLEEERLKNEMHDLKAESLTRLSKIVHPEFTEEFAKILSYGWANCEPEAEKIAYFLNLEQKHFLSVDDNLEGLKDHFAEQNQQSYDFDLEGSYD